MVIDLAQFCSAAGDDVTVICSPDRIEQHFLKTLSEARGIKLVFSPMRREIGLHDVKDAWKLLRNLRKVGPFDIIHGHSSKAGALVRIAGIFLPKAKKVYTAHGFITMAPAASRVYRLIEKILGLFCNAIVAVSEGEGRHALSIGLPASKVKVIPNGTAMTDQKPRDEARRELGIPQDQLALGLVGRMESQKNPVLAVEAFALASKKYPELNFYLIGEGSLIPQVDKKIKKHKLQNKVLMLGFKNSRQLMAAFDALVCSSDYETLPITFLEALNAGVPVITRHVGGVEEAILENETGFLAKTQSAEGLAEAIRAFAATTPDQRRAMHEKTKQHAKNFTQRRMGLATRQLYAELMKAR